MLMGRKEINLHSGKVCFFLRYFREKTAIIHRARVLPHTTPTQLLRFI